MLTLRIAFVYLQAISMGHGSYSAWAGRGFNFAGSWETDTTLNLRATKVDDVLGRT